MSQNNDTVPKRFRAVVEKHPEIRAVLTKDINGEFQPITYQELYQKVKGFAMGLHSLGVKRGDHLGIISDNRFEWYIADIALLTLGAVDVPRGSDSTADEIGYILGHADCHLSFAENKTQVEKILSKKKDLPLLKKIILFEGNFTNKEKEKHGDVEFFTFKEISERGETALKENPNLFEKEMEEGKSDDLATIIYTSGTTGEPKGAMLTHRNFIFQLERVYDYILVSPGDVFLSILPVWHSFERAVDYIIMNIGATIAYSKPIGKIMLEDMQKVKPHWMASVPRIWEGIRAAIYRNVNSEGGIKKALFHFFVGVGETYAYFYNMFRGLLPQFRKRIRSLDIIISIIPLILLSPLKALGNILVFSKLKARLGGKFIAGISGGGALPPYVDRFFQAAGVLLLEGYGLTETAPILAVRKQKAPVTSTVGPLLRDIEYRVLDENLTPLPPGHKGVLWVKSDQVMKGYYKKPEATAEVLQDGWLNTGDIVIFTHTGEFKVLGRAKETIVLMGGENVEPTPIEDKLVQSEYIDQAMVVGQDQKFLGALIVPNMEKLEQIASAEEKPYIDKEELLEDPEIQNVIYNEIQHLVNSKTGFKPFERIFRFKLLAQPFEVGKELTHTLKIRRDVVNELYKKEIKQLLEHQ